MKRQFEFRMPGMRTSPRIASTICLAACVIFTSACDVHGASDPGALSTLVVSPSIQSMPINATQQFSATGRDFAGVTVTMSPTWSVVAGGGAISSTGMFSAGTTPGTYTSTVQAKSGRLTSTATVIVTVGALASIAITPSPTTLAVGGTQQFTAVGRDAAGNAVAITPEWAVTGGGGTIAPSTGLFTAGTTSGTFANTVRVTSGALSATATVTVTAGPVANIIITPHPVSMTTGAMQQFTATAQDAAGNFVAVTPVWSVTNGGGSIASTTGVFVAGNTTGTFANTVRGTVGGVSGTATVTVTAGALTSITVSPNPDTTNAGGTRQFTAVGRDANGNVVLIAPTWSVTNGGGSIGSSTGLFTAGNIGGTFVNTIRATSGGVSGTATETVIPLATVVATITVSPNPATLATGDNRQFIAVGRDGAGNVVAITPTWSVVNGGGTIASGTGVFTAGNSAGTFSNTVRATSGVVSGFATVNVTAITPPAFVPLGAAASNGIMAGTAVTCVTGGIINADVSISPGNTLTGFGPCIITGVQHLANGIAAQAQIDLTTAYNTLAGMACPPANAIAANLGGTTKPAGVYCTASGIGVTGTLTLDGGGDPNAAFVFKAGTSLTTAGDIVLINGAQAKNVYWLVGSSATIGTASKWQGNIIALTSITLVDNATLTGRALARNGAVSLGTNNIIILP